MKIKAKTIGSLAEWIVKNRKGDAFKEDTLEQIVLGLQADVQNGNLLYVLDNDCKFIGIITFLPDRIHKILMVRNLLITSHTALVIFAQHFKQMFDGYGIIALRGNKEVQYNTPRLINHLLHS